MVEVKATIRTKDGGSIKVLLEKKMDIVLDEMAKIIAEDILERAKENIVNMNIETTGTLRNSGKVTKVDKRVYKVGFYAPYAVYVETGTNRYARPPPFAKIYLWVKQKFGYDDRRAWAVAEVIQQKIFRYGTSPNPFFRKAIYSVINDLRSAGVKKIRFKEVERGRYELYSRRSLWDRIKSVFERVFGR